MRHNQRICTEGKNQAVKLLKQHDEFIETFSTLGRSPEISDSTFEQLERFTCLLYGSSTTSDINVLQFDRFLARFTSKPGMLLSSYNGVDMSLLPPCKDALRMHIRCANYQALIWYQADQTVQNLPPADGHGWCTTDGKLEIKWTEGDMLPQELVDIMLDEPEQSEGQEELPELYNLTDTVFE